MAERRFSYHRAVASMLWVLVALCGIELLAVHVLVSFWLRWVALALSLISAGTIAWLIVAILSMRRLPVTIDPDRIVMRVGTLRRAIVPLGQVAGLRPSWDVAYLKQRSVLNLALVAWPNIVVALTEPLPGRRGIVAIAHRLDDPAGFAAALDGLRAAT